MSQVLEVTWWWKNELLAVQHVPNVDELTLRSQPRLQDRPFLKVRRGSVELPVPSGAPVTMRAGQQQISDDALLTVQQGETARVVWHGLIANICWVDSQKTLPRGAGRADTLWWQVTTGVGGLTALLGAIMMVTPREAQDAIMAANTRIAIQFIIKAPEVKKPIRLAGGGAHPKPAGVVGVKRQEVVHAAKPRANTRAQDLALVRGSGVLALLNRHQGALGHVFNADLGGEFTHSLGALTHGPSDVATGEEGWASRGHGTGGHDAIGVGELGPGRGKGPPGPGDVAMQPKHAAVIPTHCKDCSVAGDGLSKDEISRVLRRYLNQIRYCYEKQLNTNPNLSGKVSVTFVIGGTGRVDSADVAESSLNYEATESCVTNIIRRIQFTPPRGGGTVLVNYPFVFQTAGQ